MGKETRHSYIFGFCPGPTHSDIFVISTCPRTWGPFHLSTDTLDALGMFESLSHVKFLATFICQYSLLLFPMVSLSILSSKGLLLSEYTKAIILGHLLPLY